jgi:5-methylcytosine-specific restriction enzyme A
VSGARCLKHPYDDGQRDPDTKRLYNSKRWQRIRAGHLAKHPYCWMCVRDGKQVKATEVDHVYPHHGDALKFFAGPFQSMCKPHHSMKTRHEQSVSK